MRKNCMPDFAALLDEVCRRPGLYVGRCSLRSVAFYLNGYDHALLEIGNAQTPWGGFQRWVELRFLISHAAWHWSRILLHVYGSDEAAIAALPGLYREYLSQREAVGADGIEAECRRR